MLNILRMDVRRLLRTRSLYATLVVLSAVILVAAIGTWYMTEKSVSELIDYAQKQMAEEGIEGGADMDNIAMAAQFLDTSDARVVQLEMRRQMSFNTLSTMPFTGSFAHTLLAMLIALFASKDYATGYFKNLLAMPGVKTKWLLSKVVVMVLCILLTVAVVLGVSAIGTLILGNPMEIDWPKIMAFMGQHMLISFTLNMLVLMILIVTQNKTAAQTLGIMLSVNTQNLLYMLLDLTDWLPFRFKDWGLMNQAMKISLDGPVPERLPIIAAVLISFGFIVSLLGINRRDLKM